MVIAQDGYESAEVLVVSTSETERKWILDSRCSFHMTPNKACFETFKIVNGGQVILGNNKACDVQGIGIVRLKLHDGVERVLQQVRYIHGFKRNLISFRTLGTNGYA